MFELGLFVFFASCIALFVLCVVLSIFTLVHAYKQTKKMNDLVDKYIK